MSNTTAPYWLRLLPGMFPMYEEALGEANSAHLRVISILDFLRVENWIDHTDYHAVGRPKIDRDRFLRAFVAKSILNISTTKGLIDRLSVDRVLRRICGWIFNKRLPCEASFSNAFSEFSRNKICEKIHAALVEKELENDLIFHVSRDSTAIQTREAPAPKVAKLPKVARPRGRPKKGEIIEPKDPTRLEKQRTQTLEEMLEDLHGPADYGSKNDSHGNQHAWIGFKLHLDVADGGIPISAVLTPASIHDSGASKPLQCMTSKRVKSLYLLADKAYSAAEIRSDIFNSSHVPIIPFKGSKSKPAQELENFEKRRFKERSTVERVYSQLKDSFGFRNVMVKGAEKVMCHLMFGLLSLTCEALMRM